MAMWNVIKLKIVKNKSETQTFQSPSFNNVITFRRIWLKIIIRHLFYYFPEKKLLSIN